jgi:AraC-like DNA-binding protein
MHLIRDVHEPFLNEIGFRLEPIKQTTAWRVYQINKNNGKGVYRLYSPNGTYAIAIHDFTLYKDMVIHCVLPEYLSITWYDSVSGEALKPYKRLKRGHVKGYHSNAEGYHALVHKDIPIYAVGIEVSPEYLEKYLTSKYPGEFINPRDAFLHIDENSDFPEMVHLLHQVRNFKGNGTAEELFYEGKVHEAMALLIERTRRLSKTSIHNISAQDMQNINSVTAYINDHIVAELRLDLLAQIACMSQTKLKTLFKKIHGLTITEYIQHRRISHAEMVLSNTDLPIITVAQSVGYHSPGRFAKLFQKDTGLLPSEYKKMILAHKED